MSEIRARKLAIEEHIVNQASDPRIFEPIIVAGTMPEVVASDVA